MDNEKQAFEKQLNVFAKAGQWYVLPFLLMLSIVVGYLAFGMGTRFDETQVTLLVVFVILVIIDVLVVLNLKRK